MIALLLLLVIVAMVLGIVGVVAKGLRSCCVLALDAAAPWEARPGSFLRSPGPRLPALAAVADDLDAAIETAAPTLAPIMPSLTPATT